MKRIILLLLITSTFTFGCKEEPSEASVKIVSAEEMKELSQLEDVQLLDVRTPEEVAMEAVPGAVNIPLDEVPARWEEFKSMSRPLVLFCRSGGRSGQALMFLASKGIEDGMNGGGASDVMIHKM